MAYYLDTCVLVATWTQEPETTRAQEFLAANADQPFHVSEWVLTEFSFALAMKIRTKSLSVDERALAERSFSEAMGSGITILPFSSSMFKTAANLAMEASTGLRASDALHLAIAREHDCIVCTLDRGLIDAASRLGYRTLLP